MKNKEIFIQKSHFFLYYISLYLVYRIDGLEHRLQYRHRYPCPVCGKSYLRKAHLKRHTTNECVGIAPKFCCEFCPSRYKRNEDLKRHMCKVHNIISPKSRNSMDPYADELSSSAYYASLNSSLPAVLPHPAGPPIPSTELIHRLQISSSTSLNQSSYHPHRSFNDQDYFLDC